MTTYGSPIAGPGAPGSEPGLPGLGPGDTKGTPSARLARSAGPLASWFQIFIRNRPAVAAVAVLAVVCAFSFLGPLFYHTDQVHANLGAVNLPPGSAGHPLGTDANGMDQLGRLMVGGQVSIEVGVAAAVLATSVGMLWGAIAGYLGGIVDTVMMRLVDSGLSFPSIFLIVLLAAVVTPSKTSLVLVIALISWLWTARLVRAESLSLRTRDFVAAARVMGAGATWMISRHVAPNTLGTVMVNVTFQVADAVLLLAALGYLGLGLPQPQTDLGAMLSQGLQYVYSGSWWLIWPPGLMIIVLVAAVNFIGDGMRDAFDVRLQRR